MLTPAQAGAGSSHAKGEGTFEQGSRMSASSFRLPVNGQRDIAGTYDEGLDSRLRGNDGKSVERTDSDFMRLPWTLAAIVNLIFTAGGLHARDTL